MYGVLTPWGMTKAGFRPSSGALLAALLPACIAYQLNVTMLSPVLASIEQELQVTPAGPIVPLCLITSGSTRCSGPWVGLP